MQRLIALDGCLNFRDLGGYPTARSRRVRWRRLFRSDALHMLTAADVRRLRDALDIRDVIDLRSSAELRADGRGLLASEPIGFHHIPLFDGAAQREVPAEPMNLADRYFLLAGFARAAIASVVQVLARSTGAAVYHCAAGKDRTGVVSAVILGALGVDDGIIAADYAATQENLDAIVARLMGDEGYRTMLDALPPDTLHANPETMTELLDRMRRHYGSMQGYLTAAGVDESTLSALESVLTEDA